MSIVDIIYNGSYDGFPFVIEASTTTGGRKTSKKEYPNRNDQTIEDLGLRPRGYTLKIVVHSSTPDNYFRERDAFLNILDKGGARELTHPYYGRLSNMAVTSWTLGEEDTRLGEGKLTVTFDPSEGTGVPEVAAVTASAVKKATFDLKVLNSASFISKFKIDNSGIGGTPFLTFSVSHSNGFTQEDLDNNLTSCVITGNNEVGKGNIGDKLFGKVVWVSSEFDPGTKTPALCAVQARGVARFKFDRDYPPVLSHGVELDGSGKIMVKSERNLTGKVIAIDLIENTCDVWLG